jgi:hypothetical protein
MLQRQQRELLCFDHC